MSLKPGAEALHERILQPEASSQLLQMIPNGLPVLPPVLPPRTPFPEGGWHGTPEMSSEAIFSPLI